jgi:flagellar motility protein MotE (MotC chaperone)
MVDLFISFMVGMFTGFVTGSKDKDWKEQQKMYDARLQDQANTIEYYKKLTKKLVAENEALREQIKHLETQVYGGSTK